MPAINFPEQPGLQTPENTFSPVSVPESSKNGITYTYDNGVWSVAPIEIGGGTGDGNASIITSDYPPNNPPPKDGDLWWNTSNNTLYIYYVDEDTSQWVVSTPNDNNGGAQIEVGEEPPSSPTDGALWWNTDDNTLYIYYDEGDGGTSQWVIASPGGSGGSGGVGGSLEIPASDEPPTLPSEGDLWWSTTDNTLYIYYRDEDTEQWVVTVPSAGIGTLQQVTDAGNNTTNNITLGTDKITLDATDGNAEFKGVLTFRGTDSPNGVTAVINSSTAAAPGAFTVNTTPDLITANPKQTIFGLLNTVGSNYYTAINHDGSALFAGGVTNLTADGDITFTPPAAFAGVQSRLVWTTESPFLSEVASIEAFRGADHNAITSLVFSTGGGSAGALKQALVLNPDGSASFKNTVIVDGPNTGAAALLVRSNYQASTGNQVLLVRGNADNDIAWIAGDGSANFAGTITAAPTGTITDGSRYTVLSGNGTGAGGVTDVMAGSYNSSSSWLWYVKRDGSASFAGKVNSGSLGFGLPADLTVNGATTGYDDGTKTYQLHSGSSIGTGAKFGFHFNKNTTPTITFQQNGNIEGANVVFNLDLDNDDNYTTTTEEYTETESYTGPLGNTLEREVTKTRDIRTYTGPTLDVKERLTKADNALIALKSAAEAATDFAELKAAIVTALADI